jgi:hypothetical protein
MTAPITSGWSKFRRVGFAPTGKAPPFHGARRTRGRRMLKFFFPPLFTNTVPTAHIFKRFLHETFQSSNAGEEEQQVVRVQEFAGATMLGIMYRYQKAVLFQEPFRRAGKGTLERVVRRLVPPSFVTAVSPLGGTANITLRLWLECGSTWLASCRTNYRYRRRCSNPSPVVIC